MKYDRLLEIENFIKEKKSLTIEELLDAFDISIQTLRRDLKELEDKGSVKKVYGGVVYNEKNGVIDIAYREVNSLEAKKEVGELASSLISNNDVIFIDSGTTACQIIPYIKDKKNLTIITHSLLALKELENRNDIKVILMGGEYRNDIKSFVFDVSKLNYNFNISFISTVGFDDKAGLTNNDYYEGQVKSEIIKHSKKICVVLDHTKFDKIMFNSFASLSDIDIVVSDEKVSKKYEDLFREYKILYICD